MLLKVLGHVNGLRERSSIPSVLVELGECTQWLL